MALPVRVTRRITSGAVAVAVAFPLVLAGPAADAQTRTIRDRVGDARKHIDIRNVTIAHRTKAVKVTIRGRRGQAGFTGRAVDYAYLRVKAGRGNYYASAAPGGPREVIHLDADGDPSTVRCPRLRIRFAFERSRIRIVVPRSCIGHPRRLRGDLQVQSGRTGRVHDEVSWKRPIRRG